jgi:hypothetical protein
MPPSDLRPCAASERWLVCELAGVGRGYWCAFGPIVHTESESASSDGIDFERLVKDTLLNPTRIHAAKAQISRMTAEKY